MKKHTTLLSNKQAAHYIGVSVATMNRYRSTGRPYIPHYKVGGRCKYLQEELDDFVKSVRKGAACEGFRFSPAKETARPAVPASRSPWRIRRLVLPSGRQSSSRKPQN